jgi:nitrite reductase (NADH) small subunit
MTEATEVEVGRADEFADGDRRAVHLEGGREVVVFRVGDGFHAYENVCPHQGGPVCEGKLIPRVEAVLDDAGDVVKERFARDKIHLVCPWHGWEFRIESGECVPDPRMRLRRYDVTQRDGAVFVSSQRSGVRKEQLR